METWKLSKALTRRHRRNPSPLCQALTLTAACLWCAQQSRAEFKYSFSHRSEFKNIELSEVGGEVRMSHDEAGTSSVAGLIMWNSTDCHNAMQTSRILQPLKRVAWPCSGLSRLAGCCPPTALAGPTFQR